jgi:CRP-like cAMP-binding protein
MMNNKFDIAGNLEFLTLADVIQLLGSNNGTGTLKLKSKYAQEPGLIYFKNGNPIDAVCRDKKKIEALFALFGWLEGEFEFLQEEVNVARTINKNRMEIILDGLRMLDDDEIEKLGPVTYEKKPSETAERELPLIKGPLVDYMYVVDEEEFYDGEDIVVEGNHGNWIWVILEGVVEILKETPEGRLKIFRIGDGAFIGNINSLLSSNSVRTATAVAVGNVQLGMLDSQQFSNEFARLSSELKSFIKSLDGRLGQVSQLAVQIRQGKKMQSNYIKGRKVVIKQGDSEEKLLKIIRGDVTVARKVENQYIPVTTLTKGDYFGYIPFLNIGQEPYSAFVLAQDGLKVKSIDVADLQEEYEQLSTTFKNYLSNLATCISASSVLACDFHKRALKTNRK